MLSSSRQKRQKSSRGLAYSRAFIFYFQLVFFLLVQKILNEYGILFFYKNITNMKPLTAWICRASVAASSFV